jgi:hypothetical protein
MLGRRKVNRERSLLCQIDLRSAQSLTMCCGACTKIETPICGARQGCVFLSRLCCWGQTRPTWLSLIHSAFAITSLCHFLRAYKQKLEFNVVFLLSCLFRSLGPPLLSRRSTLTTPPAARLDPGVHFPTSAFSTLKCVRPRARRTVATPHRSFSTSCDQRFGFRLRVTARDRRHGRERLLQHITTADRATARHDTWPDRRRPACAPASPFTDTCVALRRRPILPNTELVRRAGRVPVARHIIQPPARPLYRPQYDTVACTAKDGHEQVRQWQPDTI